MCLAGMIRCRLDEGCAGVSPDRARLRSMKILICDDHALFRQGLLHVLSEIDGSPRLLESGGIEELWALLEEHDDADLLLLDLRMPGVEGLEALTLIRDRYPAVPVVIVSATDSQTDVVAALDAGALGFVPKSSTAPVLLGALQLVLSGGVYIPPQALGSAVGGNEATPQGPPPANADRASRLTPRQLEVLRLMARGLTNRDICRVLEVAEGTVKAHVAAILETLDVSNRTEAVGVMHELGLDSDPD